MKKIIFLFLVGFPFFAIAQEPLTFSEVIEVSGADKSELFTRGREWFNETFNSANDVLQIADKETGELIGKCNFTFYYIFKYMGKNEIPAMIEFQISLWLKDGKYKYELTKFFDVSGVLISTSDVSPLKPTFMVSKEKLDENYLIIKGKVIEHAKKIVEELKLKMSKSAKASEW